MKKRITNCAIILAGIMGSVLIYSRANSALLDNLAVPNLKMGAVYVKTAKVCTLQEYKNGLFGCDVIGYMVNCPDGTTMREGRCVKNCDTTVYKLEGKCDESKGVCSTCQGGDGDRYVYTSCKEGYSISNGSCVAAGCSGYPYTEKPVQNCRDIQQCKSGTTYKYKCSSCQQGYTLSGSKCNLTECPCHPYSEHPDSAAGSVAECQSGDTVKYGYTSCNEGWDQSGCYCNISSCPAATYPFNAQPDGQKGVVISCLSGHQWYYGYSSCHSGWDKSNGDCVPSSCNSTTYPYDRYPDYAAGNIESCKTGNNYRYRYTSCNSGWTGPSQGKCTVDTCNNNICATTRARDSKAGTVETCYKGTTTYFYYSSCKDGFEQGGSNNCDCIQKNCPADKPYTTAPDAAAGTIVSSNGGFFTCYGYSACNPGWTGPVNGVCSVASCSNSLTSCPERASCTECTSMGKKYYKATCPTGFSLCENNTKCCENSCTNAIEYCPPNANCEHCYKGNKVYYEFKSCAEGFEEHGTGKNRSCDKCNNLDTEPDCCLTESVTCGGKTQFKIVGAQSGYKQANYYCPPDPCYPYTTSNSSIDGCKTRASCVKGSVSSTCTTTTMYNCSECCTGWGKNSSNTCSKSCTYSGELTKLPANCDSAASCARSEGTGAGCSTEKTYFSPLCTTCCKGWKNVDGTCAIAETDYQSTTKVKCCSEAPSVTRTASKKSGCGTETTYYNGTCTTCNQGFNLNSPTNTTCTAETCSGYNSTSTAIDNCKTTSSCDKGNSSTCGFTTKYKCDECCQGYTKSTDNKTCSITETAYTATTKPTCCKTPQSTERTAGKTPGPGCGTLTTYYNGICDACEDGYGLSGDKKTCTAVTCSGYNSDSKPDNCKTEDTCKKGGSNCSFTTKHKCTKCNTNYYVNTSNTCSACDWGGRTITPSCPTHCSCDSHDGGSESECGIKFGITGADAGYYPSSSNNTCPQCNWGDHLLTECPANCVCNDWSGGGNEAYCGKKYKITGAVSGYMVDGDQCVPACQPGCVGPDSYFCDSKWCKLFSSCEETCCGFMSCPAHAICSSCQRTCFPGTRFSITGCQDGWGGSDCSCQEEAQYLTACPYGANCNTVTSNCGSYPRYVITSCKDDAYGYYDGAQCQYYHSYCDLPCDWGWADSSCTYCECYGGYTGTYCDVPPGGGGGGGQDCSSYTLYRCPEHGICDQCTDGWYKLTGCESGWTGSDCSTSTGGGGGGCTETCTGLASNSGYNCTGTCTTCSGETRYTGCTPITGCSQTLNCGLHGSWNSSTCSCDCTGCYSGSTCSSAPNTSCGGGKHWDSSSCQCVNDACNCSAAQKPGAGYTCSSYCSCDSSVCEQWTCNKSCGSHGSPNAACTACVCTDCYSGSTCSTAPANCGSHGSLNSSCTCSCDSGWEGATCSTNTCDAATGANYPGCGYTCSSSCTTSSGGTKCLSYSYSGGCSAGHQYDSNCHCVATSCEYVPACSSPPSCCSSNSCYSTSMCDSVYTLLGGGKCYECF